MDPAQGCADATLEWHGRHSEVTPAPHIKDRDVKKPSTNKRRNESGTKDTSIACGNATGGALEGVALTSTSRTSGGLTKPPTQLCKHYPVGFYLWCYAEELGRGAPPLNEDEIEEFKALYDAYPEPASDLDHEFMELLRRRRRWEQKRRRAGRIPEDENCFMLLLRRIKTPKRPGSRAEFA